MQKTSGKEPLLRGLKPRLVALAIAYWMAVGVAAHATGLLEGMDRVLTEPLELKARLALQRAPAIDPKLKIFNFDDSTFAQLRRPSLNGGQWASLIRTLLAAKPRAIVTTHMFGTGELEDESGALALALEAARARGTDVVAGVFAYPGALEYREAVPLNIFSFIEGDGVGGGAGQAGDLRGGPGGGAGQAGDLRGGPGGASEQAGDLRGGPGGASGQAGDLRGGPDGGAKRAGDLRGRADEGGAVQVRAKDLRGWRVYGPDGAGARHFTRLGHQGYEGDGRASLLVRVGDGTLVPHLALAVAHKLRVSAGGVTADGVEIPLDAHGRTRIDVLPAATLAARAKSLNALLTDAKAGVPARYVAEGDVVLLLMDMYTGKVNFAPTPLGPVPGGYLWAAVLNSLLAGRWIRETGAALPVVLAAPLVGAVAGIAAEGLVFIAGLNFLPLLVVAAGISSFVFRGVAVPWLPAVILAWAAACTLFFLKARTRNSRTQRLEIASDREAARLAAIVRTAQMFAHDVRKPFSLLNMALVAIKREPNPARVGALLANLAPELGRAMSAVEAMIKDIMEIDAHARLERQETDLAALVAHALQDVWSSRPKADVLVSYHLAHTLPVEADAARLTRVVGNIIDNAVQAMGGRGRLWIKTQEVLDQGQCFIELVIGNSGSFVPRADRARIFDAFFTSGKKDGTGLGLAIAHKIIAGHGGRIWCESSEDAGTEFHLTLPVAQATPFVASSAASALAVAAVGAGKTAGGDVVAGGAAVAAAAAGKIAGSDAAAAAAAASKIAGGDAAAASKIAGGDAAAAAGKIAVGDAAAASKIAGGDAAAASKIRVGDAAAASKIAGGDAAAAAAAAGKIAGSDAAAVTAAAADKAASGGVAAAGKAASGGVAAGGVAVAEAAAGKPASGMRYAVVDDNPFVLEAWALAARDEAVEGFAGPEEFLGRIEREPELLAGLDALVTDFHFDGSALDGIELARRVKALRRDLPIFLSTDGDVEYLPGDGIAAKIAKEPVSFGELLRRRA